MRRGCNNCQKSSLPILWFYNRFTTIFKVLRKWKSREESSEGTEKAGKGGGKEKEEEWKEKKRNRYSHSGKFISKIKTEIEVFQAILSFFSQPFFFFFFNATKYSPDCFHWKRTRYDFYLRNSFLLIYVFFIFFS